MNGQTKHNSQSSGVGIPLTTTRVSPMSLLLQSLKSPSAKWAVGGWTFFIVENVVLSENRTFLIEKLGDDGYHCMYGTISTAAMGSVGYAYFRKLPNHGPPLRWPLSQPTPFKSQLAAWSFLTLGLTMASQALPKLQIPIHYASTRCTDHRDKREDAIGPAAPHTVAKKAAWKVRCPFDFADSKSQNGRQHKEIHGLDRISRHAGLWSFGFIGLAQSCLVPSIPQSLWWSMPIWVALIGGSHTDSRHLRNMGGTLSPEYSALTSNVPFLALLMGRQGNVLESLEMLSLEMKPLNAMLATGVATLWVLRKGRGGVPRMPSSTSVQLSR